MAKHLMEALANSKIYQDYERAFSEATGLPVALRSVESWQLPHHGKRFENPFCAMLAQKSRSCAACLQVQQKLSETAVNEPQTVTCQAGLCDTAVPVRMGDQLIGFLTTGQVFRKMPTEAQFNRTTKLLAEWGVQTDAGKLREAYFDTRVLSSQQHESVVKLLAIFAEHLSMVSNQIVVRDQNAEPPVIARARQFIAEHQTEELSLEQVATAVHTSKFYFCKMFKKATGINFTDYLSRVRTERAKNLLLNPNLRVSEIAYEVGFQSLTHFNRVFKRILGSSPTHYREQLSRNRGLIFFSRVSLPDFIIIRLMKNYGQLTRAELIELVGELQRKATVNEVQQTRHTRARQKAERALLHYAAMVESSDDAIIGKTLEGYITSWNRGAEMVFGFTRKEMIGKPVSILIPDDRKDEEPGILEKIRRGESVDHYETVRRRKDGKLIDISVTVSPIRDADGKIIGASKVARDITERKRLEQEIIEISNREQQRIGQDLHDGLCQELAGIELMCQVLEQKLAAKSKAESKQAGEIAQHVRDAISHTRKLARGLSPVELETNGFMSALQELAAHVQKLFHIECRIECPQPVLIRNNVFATHLYRIVQEAINNAVKHGKAKHIVISLKPSGDKTVLSINDDGVGFSHETKKGGGMGLHIMKYRAGVVNATLDVHSTADGVMVACIFRKNL